MSGGRDTDGGRDTNHGREEILRAVRAALADASPAERTAAAEPLGRPREPEPPGVLVERFAARVTELGARVTRCGRGAEAIAAAVAAVCAQHGARRLALPGDLDAGWLPSGVEGVRDEPALSHRELDELGAALTRAATAIAETGTIVLDGGAGQGRRALSLLVDLHLCVVFAEQVLADVPEAIAAAQEAVRGRGAPLTLITGPSATSDIELRRVEGVHGPRRLEVLLSEPLPSGAAPKARG
jgi:L-lactate dehydrogenase complex protein LldG